VIWAIDQVPLQTKQPATPSIFELCRGVVCTDIISVGDGSEKGRRSNFYSQQAKIFSRSDFSSSFEGFSLASNHPSKSTRKSDPIILCESPQRLDLSKAAARQKVSRTHAKSRREAALIRTCRNTGSQL
jgi:hypothetical protein